VITSKEAAAIAHAHGLSMTDAAALARLADTPAEAEEFATLFATPADPVAQVNNRIRQRATRGRVTPGEGARR
jgi:hypothetical protein